VVLLLGTDYKAGPWAARSLRDAGYRVVGAHTAGGVLAGGRSRACPAPLRHPPAGLPEFRPWIEHAVRRVGADAVLATTEDLVAAVAQASPDLGRAVFAGPDGRQYAALCDKSALADTAAAAGVDHPRWVSAWPDLPDDAPLPAVVKARDSGEAIDRVGRAVICHTRDELRRAVDLFGEAGGRPIVQELLVGRRWNFHGLARGEGARGFATEVVREYPRARGITSLARSVVPPPPFAALVDSLVAATGYRGPISVQVIERADGRFAVHDVNLRLPASVGLTIRAGLDLPRLAVDDALGRPLATPPAAPRRVAYLGVDGEVRALGDALRGRGAESPREVLAGVARVLRGHRPVLDPHPLDPFWIPLLGARALRRRLRSATPA